MYIRIFVSFSKLENVRQDLLFPDWNRAKHFFWICVWRTGVGMYSSSSKTSQHALKNNLVILNIIIILKIFYRTWYTIQRGTHCNIIIMKQNSGAYYLSVIANNYNILVQCPFQTDHIIIIIIDKYIYIIYFRSYSFNDGT